MERDLETAEIVDQVRHAQRRLAGDERRLTNVVYKGMGDPVHGVCATGFIGIRFTCA